MGTESPSLPSLCRRFDVAALISHVGTPRSRPPLPGSANPGGHGREPGGLRCHLWGGVNNPSVYQPGSELVFSAEPPSPRFLSPHPLRNKTQHKNKTRRRTEVIHRLYPIINIQAVVCTNTPSNHGGSPGRRVLFKLGSAVAPVPPPGPRSAPQLPGERGRAEICASRGSGPRREKGS